VTTELLPQLTHYNVTFLFKITTIKTALKTKHVIKKVNIKIKILLTLFLFSVLILTYSILYLPKPLFSVPYSTVAFDRGNNLIGARIADDGQWRFSEIDSIPQKFKYALLTFEDNYYYLHPGFNIISLFEALMSNIKAGKVIRGGSTITMQVIRLSRKGKPRDVLEKIKEIILSTALEIKMSKEEILKLYVSHAPFGGNVVGLEAAAWRYFGRSPFELSWAESSLLAVLPNAPSLIHPGKNRDMLLRKRNRLLFKLFENKMIDKQTYELAILEKIPEKPKLLPDYTPHLIELLKKTNGGEKIFTTIDLDLQKKIIDIAEGYQKIYRENEVYNMSVLVVKPYTKEIVAYIGNINNMDVPEKDNDMIIAKRSTGSILKPILYAAAIDEGQILINSIIPDIPSYFKNYHPLNFDNSFEGVVPASQALSRSRNVPAVYLLRDYGIGRFLELLRNVGFSSFNKPADYYGLSLILGGGEACLLEITSAYAGMAKTLLNYYDLYGNYSGTEFAPLIFKKEKLNCRRKTAESISVPLHAGAIWTTYKALYNVNRPQSETGWELFGSSRKIAWKTGTSFGFKDAWAVGTTADYVVGVWVGNSDGEGRTGLTGTSYAAPVMFDVFSLLKKNNKFNKPEDELIKIVVCSKSGYKASKNCPEIDTLLTYLNGEKVKTCSYHKIIFTDKDEKYRLNSKCSSPDEMKTVHWFVLPPVQEWYYNKTHPSYKLLPPYKKGCAPDDVENIMQFVYPQKGMKIFIPTNEENKKENIVFEISHQNSEIIVYWHIGEEYIGKTQGEHKIVCSLKKGKYMLTAVDENGTSISSFFEIVSK
jgi:penicillin-binding protein 1C